MFFFVLAFLKGLLKVMFIFSWVKQIQVFLELGKKHGKAKKTAVWAVWAWFLVEADFMLFQGVFFLAEVFLCLKSFLV